MTSSLKRLINRNAMAKNIQRGITERFKQAYEVLKKRGVTQVEVAGKLSWSQTSLNNVLQGKRQIPLIRALEFCKKYKNFNKVWLLEGRGEMEGSYVEPDETALQRENKLLRELLKAKDEQIKELKSKLNSK